MPNVVGVTTFKITNAKLLVPIVTLSSKDNVKLVKLSEEGFRRPVYLNKYQTKIETRNLDNNNLQDFLLMLLLKVVCSCFNNTADNNNSPVNDTVFKNNNRRYFLPRVNITNYNVLIDGRNFYDKSINDQIKKCDEIRKTATGQGEDYTTGCLLDYQYFKDYYNLMAVDSSKQRKIDSDSRAIQQIEFYGMLKINSQVCTVLEKSKETMLKLYKGAAKVL